MRQINIFPDPAGRVLRGASSRTPPWRPWEKQPCLSSGLQALHTPEAAPQRVRTRNGAGTPFSSPTCCPLTRAQRPFSPLSHRARTEDPPHIRPQGQKPRARHSSQPPESHRWGHRCTGKHAKHSHTQPLLWKEGGGQWGSEKDTPSSWSINRLAT